MILVKHNNEGNLKPYFYFALEEYILKNLLKDDEAYFFTWEIHGVVCGKNQVIENEVNLKFMKDNNLDIYRRPTGGGTIYADHRNTMYSMITKKADNFSFKPYLELVIKAMKKLDVEITFSGRNDLLFENKKISGVAFLQNKYGVLIHGTFMYDVDIETMVRAISPDNEKLISKGIDSVKSRVVNLKPYLNGMTQDELINHLNNEITSKEYVLSKEEVEMISKMAEKYESKDWRFRIQPEYSKRLSKRISGGMFNIDLNLKRGIIESVKFTGDFFDLFPIDILEEAFKNVPYTKEAVDQVLTQINVENMILDVKKDELLDLFVSGMIE
ncbi:MAG: lipoate--protein ligase [Acholeplasma sp.]|nr:lipoate--protein ligase [Acholeplasma sp.]